MGVTPSEGTIVCFFEAMNPNGHPAGMLLESNDLGSPDNYVKWANAQAKILPPGFIFNKATWAEISFSPVNDWFTLPESFNQDTKTGEVVINNKSLWFKLIMIVFPEDEEE